VIELVQTLRGPAATERFAGVLARGVRAPLVLLLEGDLGAGKTTFARGFVRALPGGDKAQVQSPTFALARSYPTTPPVHHLDLYRLEELATPLLALEELGLLEMLEDPAAVSLVEWPRDLALPALRVGRVVLTEQGRGRRARVDLPDEAVPDPSSLPALSR
jgi:tRNA threonylcarbamoyl adenosine modification protein YjeE